MTVFDFAAFTQECLTFVKKENQSSVFCIVGHLPQVLFCIPMYLLTTVERSIWYSYSFNSLAKTSAAMVLPVPLAIANRALIPAI